MYASYTSELQYMLNRDLTQKCCEARREMRKRHSRAYRLVLYMNSAYTSVEAPPS